MTQFAFGSGTLIGKRTDVSGQPPALLGTLQDVSLDFDRKIETLLGQYNMAVAAGGGEFKITGKADLDWRNNADLGVREYRVVASSNRAVGFPRREPGPNRDAPFAGPYPLYSISTTEVVLPAKGEGFTVRGPNGTETVGGLELKRTSAIKDGVATFVVETRSLVPEIPASEAEAATRAMRRIAADDSLVRAPK